MTISVYLVSLVTFVLQFESHHGSFASNREQGLVLKLIKPNLLRAQVNNSASYPQPGGK